MLVEKNPKNKIMALKLITGEEIIAEVTNNARGVITIKNPLLMVMAENPDNPHQARVMFTPWMIASGESQIVISDAKVVALVIAREDAAEQYEQAVGNQA